MDKRQSFAAIGCFLLFVGVFAPLLSVPIMGSLNYFQNGKGDGTVVLGLAVISLVVALHRSYHWLWFTGLGSLGMMAITFVHLQSRLSSLKADMAKALEGNPFREIADLAAQSVQMQWGWALLLAGALMLLIAAGMKEAAEGHSASPQFEPRVPEEGGDQPRPEC